MIGSDFSEFVEVDPSGRYGRYNDVLGKGASKTVYRAFDEYEGIEVAWNQVKLRDFLQSPEDLERLYSEIHLLKTLKHKNIMKFYSSWVDTSKRNVNFITEMFTSGTLKQYREKHNKVNIRAIKHWCRQILKGLLYLHSHDPPVIHRDLKCDNIFVNGNQGEVKIGDLGLAAILRKSHAARCVGTPEFMAPEVYKEDYNELVDIYSFGMCVLEMVTSEYPYSECSHPAQIYKKVISGKKPEALYKVKDPEVRRFVEKCLTTVTHRLPARDLLMDPFLQVGDRTQYIERDQITSLLTQPVFLNNTSVNEYGNDISHESEHDSIIERSIHHMGIEFFDDVNDDDQDDNPPGADLITNKGNRKENGIFLRLRVADKGNDFMASTSTTHVRNICFTFHTETDTALSVAKEMVAVLDMEYHDVNKIATMIDGVIASLVPDWKCSQLIEESSSYVSPSIVNCESNMSSNGSLDYITSISSAAMHGRFEEITYQVEPELHSHQNSERSSYLHNLMNEDEQIQSNVMEFGFSRLGSSNYGQDSESIHLDSPCPSTSLSPYDLSDDNEHEDKFETKWAELGDKAFGEETPKSFSNLSLKENQELDNGTKTFSISSPEKDENKDTIIKSLNLRGKFSNVGRNGSLTSVHIRQKSTSDMNNFYLQGK